MEQREITCISCPMGCLLTVTMDGDHILVSGNGCKIGVRYGQNEVTNPKRMITTSVKVKGGDSKVRMLSVKTSDTIPKEKITECLKEIKKLELEGSFAVGDVIIEDILGLNVKIVATRELQD